MAACSDDDPSGENGTIRLSGQDFPEEKIVAAMYTRLLEEGGYEVETEFVGTRDIYVGEIAEGNVDVVPDYVGGIIDFLSSEANGTAKSPTTGDPVESITAAKSLLDDAGVTLLDPAAAASVNAYFVTQEYADENSVSKLSDLRGKKVKLAAAPDCVGRQDCEAGLTSVYGIDITEVLGLGYGDAQTFKAVADGEAQLGQTGSTDGTVGDQGMVLLVDDLALQPAQNLVPLVRSDFLADHADVAEILNGLMAVLTTADIAELNRQATVDRAKPEDIAEAYLEEKDLL